MIDNFIQILDNRVICITTYKVQVHEPNFTELLENLHMYEISERVMNDRR